MNDVRKPARRKIDVAYVAVMEAKSGIAGQFWKAVSKDGCVAGQDNGLRAEFEPAVGPHEAFQQPLAKKPGPAGDEKPGAAQLLPQSRRVGQNVFQVLFQRMSGFQGWCCRA